MGKPTTVKGTFSFVGGTEEMKGIQFTRYSFQPLQKENLPASA
jgi:hypothetical protein